LIDVLLNDEHEFVRMTAASGLGAIRCQDALPALKWVILNDDFDMTLRESAYESVLQIMGLHDDVEPMEDEDSPIRIDWEFVRNL
jgi:HEAT repeat protein